MLQVTINGFVEEFSPVQSNREARPAPIEYRHDNAYKDSAKSPGLGQRMQTDLAKVGAQQPSQKEIEVRRRQAILDSLHKKEIERKKQESSHFPGKPKNISKGAYKGHLPPITGSVKVSNGDHDGSRLIKENSNNHSDIEVSDANPFQKKPAMLKRKALPEVKKAPPESRIASEESGWTSENTSDKENAQFSNGVKVNPQVQPILESADKDKPERLPLRESHSSNNDSAGNRTLVSASELHEQGNQVSVGADESKPGDNRNTSSHSQRPRSVTARDILEKATPAEYSVNHLSKGNTSKNSEKQHQPPHSSRQNVVISDTITDLESGIPVENFEKQRLEALQRLNKKTSEERARSAKKIAHDRTLADSKSTDSQNNETPTSNGGTNELNLPSNLHEDLTISDSEVAGQSMTLGDRVESTNALRRVESMRQAPWKKGLASAGPIKQDGARRREMVSPKKAPPGHSSSGVPTQSPVVKDAISEMKQREKDLIEAIKKQQEELEQVRKQRYRQERIYKSSVHKKSEKIRSESDSSRILSTEEASQSEAATSNLTSNGQDNGKLNDGFGSNPRYHFGPNSTELSGKRKQIRVRLPPKKNVNIKEDPYFAKIAEKSTPQAIEMEDCQHCGRSFAPDRLLKHTEICQTLQGKKRSEYNAPKHRLQGTGAEMYQNHEADFQVSFLLQNGCWGQILITSNILIFNRFRPKFMTIG